MRVLPRGNWLDESRRDRDARASRSSCRGSASTGPARATRLDLARWLVSRDNPLAARVFVNRLWKLLLRPGHRRRRSTTSARRASGRRTPSCSTGWRVEFVDSGWDVKHMLQADGHVARPTGSRRGHGPSCSSSDPDNRLLARQGRFRLDAELVRDNALAVSGLLVAEDRRAERQAVSAGRLLGAPELPRRASGRTDHGDEPVPPRALHLLAADVPAPEPAGLRRAEPRGVHGRARRARTRRCRPWCC